MFNVFSVTCCWYTLTMFCLLISVLLLLLLNYEVTVATTDHPFIPLRTPLQGSCMHTILIIYDGGCVTIAYLIYIYICLSRGGSDSRTNI